MDIGIGLPTTVPGVDGEQLVDAARRAERQGFASLGVLDRLVYDSYESLIALSAAAAVTERIRLATTILLAAYRGSAAVLAKQLATIDHLSGGRLVVGVAAGGRQDDFDASGEPYAQRGRRLDAQITEMNRIWAGEASVPGIGPQPVRGRIPLLVGGHSPAAMRRAARHGTGWIAGGSSATAYPELLQQARRAWQREGRADRPHMVSLAYVALGPDGRERAEKYLRDYYSYIGPKAERAAAGVIADAQQLRETAASYAEAGCDELLLLPCVTEAEQVDRIAAAVLR